MATVEVTNEQVESLVCQEMKFHIESSLSCPWYEPETIEALWGVLEFYSVPSEFDAFKEQLKWKLQMENQV